MFNVKLIKVRIRYYGTSFEIYLNLNLIESILPEIESLTGKKVTKVRTVSGDSFTVLMSFDDFADYLFDLSLLQNGGESE